MQLKFDANQPYQLDAIHAVTDLFDGQPRMGTELRFNADAGQFGAAFAAVPNRLDLSPTNLLENLHAVQARGGITPDPRLEMLEADAATLAQFGNGSSDRSVSFYNFSVEMETGTGKTYVYLRTLLELYQRCGMRKFIVVTPSIAIRQGVLKTLQITRAHFQRVYGNLPYRYSVYDSANLSQVHQFALSDGVEIMIMTLAAFNKAGNVIHQTTDRLQGETPIRLVQAARPVLILDEPQNMESEKSIAALAALHPLFALRYSATHRSPYNVVYRLTPFEAYRQGLVKRIEVASVVKEDDQAAPYIGLEAIQTQKKTVTARVKVFKRMRSGAIKETRLTVRPGDSLQDKTNRREYAGYAVEEINPGSGFVRFTNNRELQVGEAIGADKEAIFAAQIRYTIEEHLRKQERLREQGIKVLSLFFIDRVDNYARSAGRQEPGVIRTLFDQAFDELKAAYPAWRERTAEEVQAGYFAQRRTRGGEVILEDSASGEAEKDREAYELIMNAKERLLSFEEPVAFIFSHSALREGWDNPNVFQICTLNQSVSDVRKRQEVGRGVRLAVDQQGEREREERLNVLTVVANESYEKFVAGLQSEIALEYQAEIEQRYRKSIADLSEEERAAIAEEYGAGILPPRPADARKRGAAHLRKGYTLRPEFKELWERIKHKTRYAVTVDSARLVGDVVQDLAVVTVQPPRVTISKVSVEVREENAFYGLQLSTAKTVKSLAGRYPLPNLVELMSDLMQHAVPPVRLTRQTLLEIVRNLPETAQQAMLENPHEFAVEAVRAIKTRLADQLVEGIRYQKLGVWYEMSQLDTEIECWQDHLEPAEKSIYDQVVYDSQVERQFVQDLERMQEVRLYVKLPGWFTVPTPIGEYNPDWAIVWQPHDEHGEPVGEEMLYLVAETKGTKELDDLRPDEARKIRCGERHFEEGLGVRYEVVRGVEDLR